MNDLLAASLFCSHRFYEEQTKTGQLLTQLKSSNDYGLLLDSYRISLCGPVRRLQQKTQVFPLDVKASSRSRLTHSLEVATYTRLIVDALVQRQPLLKSYQALFLQALNNAAILHDIGNPPFGHYGEIIVRHWLRALCAQKNIRHALLEGEGEDLCAFNGNAQGLRIIHTIQRLNLTLGQYAAFIKIPYSIHELLHGKGQQLYSVPEDNFIQWAYAHAGFYSSEEPLIRLIRENFPGKTRHPLAYILECCDDVAYILADLEDAYERGLIDRYAILHMCDKLETIEELKALQPLLSHQEVAQIFINRPSDAIFYLRDVISQAFINDVVAQILSDEQLFFNSGKLAYAQDECPGFTIINLLRQYESAHIYTHRQVEELEISGGKYLKGLLHSYEILLGESINAFQKELSGQGGDPILRRLACRITRRNREAYFRACMSKTHSEMYLRIRLIIDYICGMTDTYAADEYHILCA